MVFWAAAGDKKIEGEMRLYYSKLKVALLKQKGRKQKKRRFKSFFANMALYANNPWGKRKLRIGKISFRKKKPMTIFTFMWKGLLSGFTSSMGIGRAK